MGSAGRYPFGDSRFFQVLAGVKVMFYFAEYPGITDGRPADHHPVNAKLHAPHRGLFRRIDIAVPKNGDMYPRISFDLAYQRPVGNAFIHLRTRTAMDG